MDQLSVMRAKEHKYTYSDTGIWYGKEFSISFNTTFGQCMQTLINIFAMFKQTAVETLTALFYELLVSVDYIAKLF